MLTARPAYAAAVTGGLVALAASGLPLGLGLLAGAAAGIAAGRLLEGRHGAELLTLAVIGAGTYAMRAVFLVTAHHHPPRR